MGYRLRAVLWASGTYSSSVALVCVHLPARSVWITLAGCCVSIFLTGQRLMNRVVDEYAIVIEQLSSRMIESGERKLISDFGL